MKTKAEIESGMQPVDYFGGCPKCGRWDEYMNVGRAHWIVCYRHRTKYWWGENLVSSWRGQSPSEWEANAAKLVDFTEVRPAYPAIPQDVAEALCRLLDELPGAESAAGDVAGDDADQLARSEAASLVRGWLDARRKAWIQFVEPYDNDEPVEGEADRV